LRFLLDDGTIIDIGPSPSEVHVSDELLQSLKRLFDLTGGAVALVSGRPIADLDRLFSPLRLPSVGGHGAEMRLDENKVFFFAKPLPEDLRKRLADPAALSPGVLVEDKKYSLVLHFLRRRRSEERLGRHMMAWPRGVSGEPTELLLGKAMLRSCARHQQRQKHPQIDGASAVQWQDAGLHR
jgi:trehalose 6-phosphate phosphatase